MGTGSNKVGNHCSLSYSVQGTLWGTLFSWAIVTFHLSNRLAKAGVSVPPERLEKCGGGGGTHRDWQPGRLGCDSPKAQFLITMKDSPTDLSAMNK